MSELRNWKHELVARALAVGKSPEEASAVPDVDGRPVYPTDASSFASNSRKRAALPDIRRRVAELRAPGIAAAAEALPGIRAAARAAGLRPPGELPPPTASLKPVTPVAAVDEQSDAPQPTALQPAGVPDNQPADEAAGADVTVEPEICDSRAERTAWHRAAAVEEEREAAAAERQVAIVVEDQQREIIADEQGVAVTVEWMLRRLAELAAFNPDDYLSDPDPVTGERRFDISRVPREKLARLTDVAQVVDEHGGNFRVRHTKLKGDVVPALTLMAKILGMREDPVANASLGDRLDRAMARERQLALASPSPPPPAPASAPSTPSADPPSDASPAPADPPDPPKPNDPDAPPDSLDELVRRRAAAGGFVAGGFSWMRSE